MTRALALLAAAIAFLAGSGPSRAQGVDMRDLMGGGPSFYRYGNGYQGGNYGGGRTYQGGGDYYGGCFVVRERVHTRYGWRIRPVQVCG